MKGSSIPLAFDVYCNYMTNSPSSRQTHPSHQVAKHRLPVPLLPHPHRRRLRPRRNAREEVREPAGAVPVSAVLGGVHIGAGGEVQ
jgi:hypothetical protein